MMNGIVNTFLEATLLLQIFGTDKELDIGTGHYEKCWFYTKKY